MATWNSMRWLTVPCALAAFGFTVGLAAGCPQMVASEQLLVSGTLERDGVSEAPNVAAVDIDYLSNDARGQWWACDMLITAGGCIDGHHVNVYISGIDSQSISDLGRGNCIAGGVARGVFERMDEGKAGIYSIGNEFSVFVLVASDVVEPNGADFGLDEETTAVSRLVSGEVEVVRFRGLDEAEIAIRGTTAEGNTIEIQFLGPMSTPAVVPPLAAPDTCVDAALVE